MAKSASGMRTLQKAHCSAFKGWGTALFIVGILFLLRDVGVPGFNLGGVQGWTVAFLCLGIYMLFEKCVEPI